jgi:two-component system, chemotaxis family, sensor kinase Cph1
VSTAENHTNEESRAEWIAFIERLVHDLREPLRSINVFAELIQESGDALQPETRQFLDEIRGGGSRMQVLLEGLAGYAMSMHEATAAPASTSLQSAFKIVLANMGEKIRAANATVTAGDLPRVAISLERAMQLFEQIIGNALRFRAERPVVIEISAVEEDGGMWKIEVQDNGIGIPPEYEAEVFRPFVRVEGKKYPGAGMGLAICKRIVEAHGGAMSMRAAAQGGVVCCFTLPRAAYQ